MSEFIKKHMVAIVISGSLFAVGIMLGLICKENERAIYVSVSYPNDGGSMFVIGRTTTSISSTDLTKISEAEAHMLIEKLSKLSATNHISSELREMVKESEGPFAKIPVDINLHFTSDSKISGPVARACKNTPIYKNPVVAYELKANTGDTYEAKGLMSLHAFWEHQKLSDCASSKSGTYDIWVSKEHVESWLEEPINPKLTNISIKANIVVSSM